MIDITKNPHYINRFSKNVPTITAGSILVTEDCNLQCTYCFEQHKKNAMSEDVARKTLLFLFNEAKRAKEEHNENRGVTVTFFGGEPTLNIPTIEVMLDYGIELKYKYNIPFNADMITNATYFPDKLFFILQNYMKNNENRFGVQLSVDGDRETQDMYRVTKTGHGSFDLVEKTIPKYKKLFEHCPDNLSVHGCANKETLPHIFHNYKFFREEWGINKIWFLPIMEEIWNDNDVKIYEENLNNIYLYILDKIKKLNNRKDILQEINYYAPLDRCMRPKGARADKPCGAGVNYCTFTAEGEIYPCHQIYYNDPEKETLIGNVWNGVDTEKRRFFLEYSSRDLSCDPTCTHDFCYRCVASNWVLYKTMLNQTRGEYCDMMKVDEKYQDKLREKVKEMGLFDGNTNQGDACKCNARGTMEECKCQNRGTKESACKCDIRANQQNSVKDCCSEHSHEVVNDKCDVVNYIDPCECNVKSEKCKSSPCQCEKQFTDSKHIEAEVQYAEVSSLDIDNTIFKALVGILTKLNDITTRLDNIEKTIGR